jgi:hypothetical protein
MGDPERRDGEQAREVFASDDLSLTTGTGRLGLGGEGLLVRASGQDSDGVRVSDSRGWTAAGDVEAGATSVASATGIPSENEHLTFETCAILVQRLNLDGGTWADPVQLDNRTGAGVDCEARDTRDPRHPLRVQVIRAEVDPTFWMRLRREGHAELPPSTAEEAAHRIWTAIERKRLRAQRDVVLVLNAIRTPWLALRPIVVAFRRQYGPDTQGIGFKEIWIVGANETFTERLDVP